MEYSLSTTRPYRKTEKGSALFVILVGVALFAALSYVVAGMMRGADTQSISKQQAKLYAGEILDRARILRETIQDLRISNLCQATEISFENTTVSGYAHGSGPRDACKIFHTDGGNIEYYAPESDWLVTGPNIAAIDNTFYFPDNVCAEDIGNGGTGCESDGTDNEDILVIVPFVKQEVCEKINKALGLAETPVVETGSAWPAASSKFTGSFADGEILDQGGRSTGCFEGSSSNVPATGTYHFFQVLWAR